MFHLRENRAEIQRLLAANPTRSSNKQRSKASRLPWRRVLGTCLAAARDLLPSHKSCQLAAVFAVHRLISVRADWKRSPDKVLQLVRDEDARFAAQRVADALGEQVRANMRVDRR